MLCYDMAASKNLQLRWFIDPSLPASLLIDSTRLQQILLNLLSVSAEKRRGEERGRDGYTGCYAVCACLSSHGAHPLYMLLVRMRSSSLVKAVWSWW